MSEAWVCLVVYEDLKPDVEYPVYPLRKIKQLIFEPPRLPRLAGKNRPSIWKRFKTQDILISEGTALLSVK